MRYKATGYEVVPSLDGQNIWQRKSWEDISTDKNRTYQDEILE